MHSWRVEKAQSVKHLLRGCSHLHKVGLRRAGQELICSHQRSQLWYRATQGSNNCEICPLPLIVGSFLLAERRIQNLFFLILNSCLVVPYVLLAGCQMDHVPFLLGVGPGEAKSSERPWSFHSATSWAWLPVGVRAAWKISLVGKCYLSSCKGSYNHTHTHSPHHVNIWVWFTPGEQALSPSVQPHQMTSKHHLCSFRVNVIATLTLLAHILIMRLLSRLWPLAKIAQNQLRQLVSYGKQTQGVRAVGWTAFSRVSHVWDSSALKLSFSGEPVTLTDLPELGQVWRRPSSGSLQYLPRQML